VDYLCGGTGTENSASLSGDRGEARGLPKLKQLMGLRSVPEATFGRARGDL